MKAQAFPLTDVRLLDGPFKHAMELDRTYLLALEPDRLLHNFRLNAGLPSTAKPLGGWEEPKGELRGHFVGHYLSACALMYASTGDERLKEKGNAVVAGLAECQAKFPSGYLSAFPEEFFDRVEAQKRVWAPYYTLHKIYAGLLDMYVHCGNQQALDVCKKFGDWVIARNAKLTDEQMQKMLGNEHGGMCESLANLSAITGERKYLEIAQRFNHQALIGPFAKREDNLTGKHANTQIPKFIGAARRYELTGDEALRTAASFFWDTVVHERSYVIGGHSDGEMFTPKEKLSTAFGPNTTETCNTYNMLKLTRHLFTWDPRAEYADYYERALFNHILASQNPTDGMTCYYVPLRAGSRKNYCDTHNSFWCCTGTGVENHAKYGDSIYWHDGARTLYVNLFIASELNWRTHGVTIRQETSFPDQPSTKLTFTCRQPVELTINVRRPAWAGDGFAINVNGQRVTGPAIRRTWKTGDTIDVAMPFTLRTEGFKDNPRRFAFLNGPIVLCAAVNMKKPFPAIVAEPSAVLASLRPVTGKPNTFTGSADIFRIPGEPAGGVTLEPFYQMHGKRNYMVYFDAFTPEQWQTKEAAYRAEIEAHKARDGRTVDAIRPGEEQNERDHNLKGEHTNSGDFGDHKYRDAQEHGWFAWDLKVLPGQAQEIWVTYWGDDRGRAFDVLVDGQKIATQKLTASHPGKYYDEIYPLTAEQTKGKEKITLKFQGGDTWVGGVFGVRVMQPQSAAAGVNLALYAEPSTSFVSGHETLDAINDGFEPRNMGDHSHGAYGNWPKTGTQWVQYEWSQPVSTRRVDVYWWDDGRGVRLPVAARLLYWDGNAFKPVATLGVAGGKYNTATFAEVTTTKLRLEMDGKEKFSTGIIEWKVAGSGQAPKFAPRVVAGPDRVVVLPAKTYLRGEVRGPSDSVTWSKASGPGEVTFGDGTAQFSVPGTYVLKLTAVNGQQSASDTLTVRVEPAVSKSRLDPVPTHAWKVNSPLWSERLKQQIVNWIPHCIAKLSEPGLKEGGFENFVEAANKNAGRPHKPHIGPPWANAYTLNTVEAMCLALLLEGDAETKQAQQAIRAKLDEWIPIILAAQEPDGYLQTRFTLAKKNERWTHIPDHEGYVAGYFIDAAVAHYWLTGKRQMYDAAKKLADCWDANIGPAPKKSWYDGHEELEQALVRLAWLVNEVEGPGKGDKYIRLSKFLLDCRRNGESYDQTHLPVTQQYEALGHAVRAAYCYSAMTDIAMETGDAEYHSAVKSLWDNIVNTKYYITGGIGSGETSEGFGKNFSLPNNAYSESCSDCGELFFQHKMNLAYHEARYADLIEETLYNAILGSVDLPAKNFTYTNPLDQTHARYGWHGCPCCVGNIPRTLLMLPTWMYARNTDGLFVNLYVGSTVRFAPDLEVVQRTDYPWQGAVEIVVNPATAKKFTLRLRAPNRNVSALYRATPDADGITSLAVNGKPVTPEIKDGYAIITREWKRGDTVRLELPLRVQRVKADERIVADRGRVALRYGPLIYNIESIDQKVEGILASDAPLTTEWKPELLGGVVAIRGQFADGSPLTAIPNYARNNRGGRSIVWIAAKDDTRPVITKIDPPEQDFFAKMIQFNGLPIKAPAVVVDDALYAAYERLAMMLKNLPVIVAKLVAAKVELHIIGRKQVTTDLPEWRHDKGKPLAEYHGKTRDERTRGMGGKLVSCGEENLLKLENDHYRGRDICLHEFAHAVRTYGMTKEQRGRFDAQYRKSLDAGRWQGSYAGSNPDEFFAELTMWYFGTHGDLGMDGTKPEHGPDGLKRYDPEAFALFDEFYGGRMSL